MNKQVLKTATIVFSLFFATALSVNAQTPDRPTTEDIFKDMDMNEDGLLEETEIKGPLKEKFQMIDTDADGYITKEELDMAMNPDKQMAE